MMPSNATMREKLWIVKHFSQAVSIIQISDILTTPKSLKYQKYSERKSHNYSSLSYCSCIMLYLVQTFILQNLKNKIHNGLLPLVEEQTQQQNDLVTQEEANRTAEKTPTTRKCTKCKAPMKGHPRGQCSALLLEGSIVWAVVGIRPVIRSNYPVKLSGQIIQIMMPVHLVRIIQIMMPVHLVRIIKNR